MSLTSSVKAPPSSRFLRLGLGLVAVFFAASCTLMEENLNGSPWSKAEREPQGFVDFRLTLGRNPDVLGKSAVTDTTFTLDSLLLVLSSNGLPSQTYRYGISGRADLGDIAVSAKVFSLSALREWKVKFYSIDTSADGRRDTVHLDSTTFAVRLGDTTVVSKTVSPAYSIVRARFLSTSQSLPNDVLFVRLRVNNVVRDSSMIGGSNASLNWLYTAGANTIYAVGDSGRILKSTNNGSSWTRQNSGTSNDFGSGFLVNESIVYAMGKDGRIYRTDNGGENWQARDKTADSVNAIYATSTNVVFAVGKNGGIYKAPDNGGWSWHTLVSNTAHHLNGVFFTSADIGFVVGENETILRTTNGSVSGGLAPQDSGIVWAPVAGGWFYQTSGNNGNIPQGIRGVSFVSPTKGYAVGAGGRALLTLNAGATWLERDGAGSNDLNAVHFIQDGVGFAVGKNGVIYKWESEYYWRNRVDNVTTRELHDIRLISRDTIVAVGANGTIVRTVNGTSPANTSGQYGGIQWNTVTSGTTKTLRGVVFPSKRKGWIVGDSGLVLHSTNAGQSWSAQASGTNATLNALFFRDTLNGFAAGNSGTILKTVNGGASWTQLTTGTSTDLNSITFTTPDTGYATGKSGIILKTINGGASWYQQENPSSQTMNRIYAYSRDLIWAVGNNGVIVKAVNEGDNWSGGGVKKSLKSVFFANSSTGWCVGGQGTILKTTNGGVSWFPQVSNTTVTLYNVFFANTSTGWASGDNGTILKTTNGGTTWTPQNSNTAISLRWIHFRNVNQGYIIGGTQSMYSTTNGGTQWNGSFVGTPGAKVFDQTLGYKYVKPGQPTTILLEAIDRLSPLRGYQSVHTVVVGAGKDSTISVRMQRCGHHVDSACVQ